MDAPWRGNNVSLGRKGTRGIKSKRRRRNRDTRHQPLESIEYSIEVKYIYIKKGSRLGRRSSPPQGASHRNHVWRHSTRDSLLSRLAQWWWKIYTRPPKNTSPLPLSTWSNDKRSVLNKVEEERKKERKKSRMALSSLFIDDVGGDWMKRKEMPRVIFLWSVISLLLFSFLFKKAFCVCLLFYYLNLAATRETMMMAQGQDTISTTLDR